MATTLPILPNTGAGNPNLMSGATAKTNIAPVGLPGSGTNTGTLPTGIAVPGQGISTGLSTANGSNTLAGDFSDTYGKGTGLALEGVLANLGTSTDNAVQATNQGILNSAGLQLSNLEATEAAHGVSADSSSASLAKGDFDSQVESTIATTDAGMELNEENTLISSLQNEGSAHGADSSFWDSLGDIGGVIGDVAGAAVGLPGIGTTATSVLSSLSSL